jgi:cobalt-zinc-cadmium efflux system protein
MERVPAHLSYDAIGRALAGLDGVTGVHDLHIWNMAADRPALSAHLTLAEGEGWPTILAGAQRVLEREFGIDHVTLQPTWPLPRGSSVIPVVPADQSQPALRNR